MGGQASSFSVVRCGERLNGEVGSELHRYKEWLTAWAEDGYRKFTVALFVITLVHSCT